MSSGSRTAPSGYALAVSSIDLDQSLENLKLERDARQDGDQRVEIWLAPLLGHLPVRLKIAQVGGDYLDLRLSAVEKP